MRRKLTLRILLKYAVISIFVLVIFSGVRFFMYNYHSEENIDMMLAQMSEQSGMGAELTSDYLRQAMGLDKPLVERLWPFGDNSRGGPSSVSPSPSSSASSYLSSPSRASTGTIGLSTGGAKDIINFRENIRNGYLPQPTDVTCEGLFYDYYFDTGQTEPCRELFCPSYTTAVTRDPLSYETEYYLSVGLNSGLKESDFQRKKLNLVLVLDVSGSMSSEFDEYYYDGSSRSRNSSDQGIMRRTKIACAREAVISILRQLDDGDSFALVLFNSSARLAMPLRQVGRLDTEDIEREIMDIHESGSTNLDSGIALASGLFREERYADADECENRIIVFTDAQPNTGDTSSRGLSGDIRKNALSGVYTTFIGIGVDFNSQLIELINGTEGANYYSVHSPAEFRERVEEEFDFMVTPLVFNLELSLESRGWRIDRVFGSPQADLSTGRLMSVSTLFPSKSSGGSTKGGLVMLKLRRLTSEKDSRIYLRVEYEDRNGRPGSSEAVIRFDDVAPEFFENNGIRKGVLLSRYAALLQNWMIDERKHAGDDNWRPAIDEKTGIRYPENMRENWEQQSTRLKVSGPYAKIFDKFYRYFEDEMESTGDYTLEQELDILERLTAYR